MEKGKELIGGSIVQDKLIDAVSFGKTKMLISEDGYSFSRFTDSQKQIWKAENPYFTEEAFDGYFYRNCITDAGIKIDFVTNSSFVKINVSKIESLNDSKNLDTEIFVDAKKVLNINECGEYSLTLNKKSRVQILLPSFAHIYFKSIEVEDNCELMPVKHRLRWLALGDSITHGVGATMPSLNYVSRIAKREDIEVMNQGNSGYVNDERIITRIDGWEPDIVTSAYGINDVGRKTLEQQESELYDCCEKLKREFPNSRIYIISPIWSETLFGVTPYSHKCEGVYKIFEGVKNISGVHLIDGLKLVPHNKKYFQPDSNHPNDMGYAYYASRLGKILFADIN